MRIRIIQQPPISSIDGIRVDCFEAGREYEVGSSIGALFLSEGWAEPLPLDSPVPYLPFSENDPFDTRRLYPQGDPPNLKRETHPPYLEKLGIAYDFQFRGRPRRTLT
jgi:hypothetical protein